MYFLITCRQIQLLCGYPSHPLFIMFSITKNKCSCGRRVWCGSLRSEKWRVSGVGKMWRVIMGKGHWRKVEMMDFDNDEVKALRSAIWVILKLWKNMTGLRKGRTVRMCQVLPCQQTSLIRRQINILAFAGHMVSFAIPKLCCSAKAAVDTTLS